MGNDNVLPGNAFEAASWMVNIISPLTLSATANIDPAMVLGLLQAMISHLDNMETMLKETMSKGCMEDMSPAKPVKDTLFIKEKQVVQVSLFMLDIELSTYCLL